MESWLIDKSRPGQFLSSPISQTMIYGQYQTAITFFLSRCKYVFEREASERFCTGCNIWKLDLNIAFFVIDETKCISGLHSGSEVQLWRPKALLEQVSEYYNVWDTGSIPRRVRLLKNNNRAIKHLPISIVTHFWVQST